jgi:hypothetical protein
MATYCGCIKVVDEDVLGIKKQMFSNKSETGGVFRITLKLQ